MKIKPKSLGIHSLFKTKTLFLFCDLKEIKKIFSIGISMNILALEFEKLVEKWNEPVRQYYLTIKYLFKYYVEAVNNMLKQ